MSSVDNNERRAFTQRAIDTSREIISDAKASYQVNGKTINLAELLDKPIIADVEDGTISIPEGFRDLDGTAIVAIAKKESMKIGDGLNIQSPTQRANTLRIMEKWGLSEDASEEFLYNLLFALSKQSEYPTVSFGSQAAATFALSIGINLKRANEIHDLPNAPSAPFGKLAVRNFVMIRYGEDTTPQVVAHELAHYSERENEPLKVISSQRAIDMRTLRSELGAYSAGAQVSRYRITKPDISPSEKKELSEDAQLYVDWIRQTLNKNDSDPFRATPEMIDRFAKDGLTLDEILHGRINFEQLASQLE